MERCKATLAFCACLVVAWMLLAGGAACGPSDDPLRGSEALRRRDVQKALLGVARSTIGESLHVRTPAQPRGLPHLQGAVRAGCFVTLEVDGRVRGCRGTLEPFTADIESEVRRNALAASLHDPLYPPLTAPEWRRARISITVVHALIPLGSVAGLSQRDGLVVRAGTKVGVVLPFEGRQPETRLAWGFRKAGLLPGASHELLRMVATRFIEEVPAP